MSIGSPVLSLISRQARQNHGFSVKRETLDIPDIQFIPLWSGMNFRGASVSHLYNSFNACIITVPSYKVQYGAFTCFSWSRKSDLLAQTQNPIDMDIPAYVPHHSFYGTWLSLSPWGMSRLAAYHEWSTWQANFVGDVGCEAIESACL